ncbi:MAG: flippase-like domain-containing protein [Gemmataceae bacterium]|nr:flippase-like domain-containing protein [Gemmataceae bacterium]
MSKSIRLLVSAALLGVVAWRTEWGDVAEAFARLRLELWLAAVALLALTQIVSALRWRLIARALGFERSLGQLTGIYYIGMYFNLLLPTSVGGDVVRAWYLDGGSGRRLAAFASVLLDRLSGLLVLLALACVALVLTPLDLPVWVPWFVWGTVLCAVLGMAALPLLAGRGEKAASRRRRLRAALSVIRSPRVLAGTTLMSLWIQVANVVLVWLVGLAIGAPVPGTYYWIVVPMVSLLTMLPVSVNGMGVREGAMVLFLAPFAAEGTATTLALLWFAVYAFTSLAGGFVYFFSRQPSAVSYQPETTNQQCPDISEHRAA